MCASYREKYTAKEMPEAVAKSLGLEDDDNYYTPAERLGLHLKGHKAGSRL